MGCASAPCIIYGSFTCGLSGKLVVPATDSPSGVFSFLSCTPSMVCVSGYPSGATDCCGAARGLALGLLPGVPLGVPLGVILPPAAAAFAASKARFFSELRLTIFSFSACMPLIWGIVGLQGGGVGGMSPVALTKASIVALSNSNTSSGLILNISSSSDPGSASGFVRSRAAAVLGLVTAGGA